MALSKSSIDLVSRVWILGFPGMFGHMQVYLVGDPIQLPATVISKRAVSHGYDVSLFKRLQEAGYPVQVLDTQYRMHPAICKFPSKQFYSGGVKTGEGVEAQTQRPWHPARVSLDTAVSYCRRHAEEPML